jgi:TatD DNase family protein
MDYHRLPSEALASSAGISALQAETADDTQAAIMDGAYQAAQAEAFAAQLDLAAEFGLNVVIHQRSAWDDTLDILKPFTGRLRAVFHCFGGSPEAAAEIAAMPDGKLTQGAPSSTPSCASTSSHVGIDIRP